MTELERKIDLAVKLQVELKETNSALMLKSGQLEDLLKDIAVSELGFSKEIKELSIPELMKKTYGANR